MSSSAAADAIPSCSPEVVEEPPLTEGSERAGKSGSSAEERVAATGRELGEASLCRGEEAAEDVGGDEDADADEEEEEEDAVASKGIEVGPRVSIKDQLEKDKDDESLRRWKEQLLGSVDLSSIGETLEPEVKITSLSILSPGLPDIVLPLPAEPSAAAGAPWFTLKEGSAYRLKFTFSVAGNIVCGLRYTSTVWKTGIKVDSTKEMLGTFSPQAEPYTYLTPEETTPSGIFARGSYSARTKFLDDDRKCYLQLNYTFDIRRDWPSS